MQNFTLQSTVGHRAQDHLERQARLNTEPFGLRTCNTLELPGTNWNRVSRIRENRNGRQVPGTNFESGSAEYRPTPRHGLSYPPVTSRSTSKNQSRSKMLQDHLIPLVERNDSESSNFGTINGDMAVNCWVTDPEPLTAYNLHYQPHQPFTPNHVQQRYHGSVQELAGIGEAVGDYLARTRNPSTPSLYLSTPEEFCGNSGSDLDRHILSTSSSFDDMFGISSPLTPKSETLTMCSTLPSDMSRQSSCIEGLGMMRLNSSISDYSPAAFGPHSDTSITISRTSNEEQSLWLAGAGGAGHYLSNQPSDLSAETVGSFEATEFTIEDMQRSQSSDSNASGSSTSSRSKQQLQRQIQLAARPIAPKKEDELVISRQGSTSSMSATNQPSNAAQDRAVTAITKIPYQRPKHERVYCKKCDEHPDGFRGEHELRRHQDRQHKLVVKKWICIEPPTRSQNDSPIIPLSKCKACQQRKKYGAYYNAAAHLRRSHFKPKPKSRVKGGKVEDKLQKRGGKGGGDFPPMTQLKKWMEEVVEMVTDNQTADVDDNDYDDAEAESILPIDNASINFHSAPEFNHVLMQQHKSNIAFKDLGSIQFDLRQDASISSLHTSASVQQSFGMHHITLNMQQQNYMPVKRHDTTSTYGPRVFMDVSPYINTSYNEDFDDIQDLEFDHLSNTFM